MAVQERERQVSNGSCSYGLMVVWCCAQAKLQVTSMSVQTGVRFVKENYDEIYSLTSFFSRRGDDEMATSSSSAAHRKRNC